MYVLLVYDIGEKRVSKVLKLMRGYLNWIQNSVFEGELTQSQLVKIKNELKKIIDETEDSVIIFTSRDKKWISKNVIGKEKNPVINFI
ncbi:CRISPR-associated endonuclease Cas2 [Clostridium prolinivorans]|jgi:CRISPR-associated protein Cas2|uniref:CRISPR-associated endonuclease Cas2 n=1 Tax=Clostridium prolinivorans TaxID=2769420 RepID=UPI000FD73258|nr:CRISPR-associated endonuclease Cas2 [Clostridium prolinivorans]